jgi:hypothetical protein
MFTLTAAAYNLVRLPKLIGSSELIMPSVCSKIRNSLRIPEDLSNILLKTLRIIAATFSKGRQVSSFPLISAIF